MTDKRFHEMAVASPPSRTVATIPVSDPTYLEDLQVALGSALPVRNVKLDFDAVGDGVTDDSDALEAAFEAVRDLHGVLYLPEGRYLTTRTLKVDGAMRVQGASRNAMGSHTDGGSVIVWGGASSGIIMRGNSGYGITTHGVVIQDLGFDGNSGISDTTGLVVGAPESSPVAFSGTVQRCYFYNCDRAGFESRSSQICSYRDNQAHGCGYGFWFSSGTGHANTATLFEGNRAHQNTKGIVIEQITGSQFRSNISESNVEQAVLIEVADTNEACYGVSFDGLWMESNWTGGTGGQQRGSFETNVEVNGRNIQIQVKNPHGSVSAADSWMFKFNGVDLDMDTGYVPSVRAFLFAKTPHVSSGTTGVIRTANPISDFAFDATTSGNSGTLGVAINHHEKNVNAPTTSVWMMDNGDPQRVLKQTKDGLTFGDTVADGVNKVARLLIPHNQFSEPDICALLVNGMGASNILSWGGGTGNANAATEHRWFVGEDNTTLIGTQRMRLNATGLDLTQADPITWSGGAGIYAGSGDPNGSVLAYPGSLYLDFDGASGSLWWKDSGLGTSTGWLEVLHPGGSVYQSGAGDPISANPTVPTTGIGSRYFDTSGERWWTATGATSNDWVFVGPTPQNITDSGAGVDVASTGAMTFGGGAGIYAGSGNPNGSVAAFPGSLYLDFNGSSGALWWKDTGLGDSSGWIEILQQGGSAYQSGSGDPITANPTVPATGIGSRYFDSTNSRWWTATGNTTGDWVFVGPTPQQVVDSGNGVDLPAGGPLLFSTTTGIYTGASDPNGQVVAWPGSLYLEFSGSTGALWWKDTGLGTSTGWLKLVQPGGTVYQSGQGDPNFSNPTIPAKGVGSLYLDTDHTSWWMAWGTGQSEWRRISNQSRAMEQVAYDGPSWETVAASADHVLFTGVNQPTGWYGTQDVFKAWHPGGIMELFDDECYHHASLTVTIENDSPSAWTKGRLAIAQAQTVGGSFSSPGLLEYILMPPANIAGGSPGGGVADKQTYKLEGFLVPELGTFVQFQFLNGASEVRITDPTRFNVAQVEESRV